MTKPECIARVMSYATDMPTVEKVSRTNAGLASELRLSVMRLRRRLALERHPDNELSLGAMAVLGALFRADGQTVGELARAEKVQPPSMTRLLSVLEDKALVSRAPHPTDGRQALMTISAEGQALLREDRRRRDAWLAQRMRALDTDEIEVLRQAAGILDKLADS